jgi:hypothetical protein
MELANSIFRVHSSSFTLKMEVANSIETSVAIYQSTWRHISNDKNLRECIALWYLTVIANVWTQYSHQAINHIPTEIIDRLLETLLVALLSSKHSAFHGTGSFVRVFKRAGVDTDNFYPYISKGPSIVIERHGGVVTTNAWYLEDPWFSCHPRGKLSSVVSW